MIRQWYEPLRFSEWLKRAFSFLNMVIFLITATLVFSEFRFDWFEKLVGSYLVSVNAVRPETGAVWEAGQQTSNAHEYLDKIISKQEDTRQTVHGAESFSDLASGLLPGEWVTLETRQFKSLYLTLDKASAVKIIEPARLVWLLSGSSVDRIFCEGVSAGIKIYFIDTQNRVIEQLELQKKDILDYETGKTTISGRLADMDGFQGRIYPAENFFDAVFKLPRDILPDLMANPELLLRHEGQITRVGIWNEVKNGYIQLGFEFEDSSGPRVVFVNGREWAVWQLSLNLKGDEN